MDPVAVERPVEPKPGPPRAIGTLNIVIGCFLFLMGLTCLGRIGPSFAQNRPFRLDPGDAQNLYDQMHGELVRQLQVREAAAEGVEEKRRLNKEQQALKAGHVKDVERGLDLAAINRDLLWFSWYFWADFVTGPVLNLLMLAAGIGLTQLRVWARKLALWVAALKIVRLVLLTSIFVFVVVPHTGRAMQAIAETKLGEVIIARMNADPAAGSKGTPPLYTTTNFVAYMSAAEYILSVAGMLVGLIYPVITLIVLTRPGAKAACSLYEDSIVDDNGYNES